MSSSSSEKRLRVSREDLEAVEMQSNSWLPDEIIYLIICKLMAFPIYLARFSAVCKHWYRLVQEHRIPPVVFVPLVSQKKGETSYQIYNFMGNLMGNHVHSLPCESASRIIGSSFGWLIIGSNDTVSLFNPLSKSHIRLPPFLEYSPNILGKGVLSKPPPQPEEEDQPFDIVITIFPYDVRSYNVAGKTAFLHVEKIGELQSKQWVYHCHWGDPILDVSRIGERLCILHISGTISCWNYSTHRFSCVKKAHWPSSIASILDSDYSGGDGDDDDDDSDGDHCEVTTHLLESSSSELLVVFCYETYNYNSSKLIVGFKILTLTSSSENWTEESDNSLGNDAILLSRGNGDSTCIQAGGSNVAAASIYFYNRQLDNGSCKRGNDMGVFNVGQNCTTHFIQHLDVAQILQGPPIWLLPSYDKML